MTDPRNNQLQDNVIPFNRSEREIEHVDSTTIVERIQMTDELKQLFREQGYEIDEN